MRILDKYILRSVLSIFLTCLLTFLMLYVVIDILSHLDDLLKLHINLTILIKYYTSYMPVIFAQVAPFSCLMATLYTFASLNRFNEIIAMRASGISIFGVIKPVLIFGLLVSLFILMLGDSYIPQSLSFNQKIKTQMETRAKKPLGKEILEHITMYGQGNSLYYANKFIPLTKTMENVIVTQYDQNQNPLKKTIANKAVFKNNNWVFYQSVTYNFDKFGRTSSVPKYAAEEITDIPETPEEFLNQSQRPELMSTEQLKNYIDKLDKSGASRAVTSLKTDLYQRYTMPFLSLIIILVGIPFSLKIRKHATGVSSLGISIILAFLYYVINAISIALGKNEVLSPLLAVSLSHILAIISSLYLIYCLP